MTYRQPSPPLQEIVVRVCKFCGRLLRECYASPRYRQLEPGVLITCELERMLARSKKRFDAFARGMRAIGGMR